MKKSNYLILASLLLFLTNCSTNQFSGEKYYLTTCALNGYTPSLQEIELNFVSSTHLEAKKTLTASYGEPSTYKNNPAMSQTSKILEYSYDNGILSIPELKLNASFENNESGELKANTNEIFYKTSIVEILDTEEARERVRKASPTPSLINK